MRLEFAIKEYLNNEELKLHLARGGKDTMAMYPCLDSMYYHLVLNRDDYIIFRNNFILDFKFKNDSRFLLKYNNKSISESAFVSFKLHNDYIYDDERSESASDQKIDLGMKKELYLCEIQFLNPNINDGRGEIFIILNGKSIHYRGILKTHAMIENVLLDYGLRIKETKVTRVDYSVMCEGYDFSYLKPSLFKRRTSKASFIEDSTIDDYKDIEAGVVYLKNDSIETITLGSRSYLYMRIYNKKEEMLSKVDIVKDILLCSRLGYEFLDEMNHFWNIEFECHRDFLKKYNLSNIEDVINSSVSMMKELMLNKFVLLTKDRTKRNAHRIPISPLWKKIADCYAIDNVNDIDLIKLQNKAYYITDTTFYNLLEKFNNCNTLSPFLLTEISLLLNKFSAFNTFSE